MNTDFVFLSGFEIRCAINRGKVMRIHGAACINSDTSSDFFSAANDTVGWPMNRVDSFLSVIDIGKPESTVQRPVEREI